MANPTTSLEARLSRLERLNRIYLIACLCLPGVALLIGASAAEKAWKGKEVTAERFVLTNEKGELRAILAIRENDGGADFAMVDKDGHARIVLTANGSNTNKGANRNSPAIMLLTEDGKPALTAGTNRDSGIGSVDFYLNGQFKGGVGGSALH